MVSYFMLGRIKTWIGEEVDTKDVLERDGTEAERGNGSDKSLFSHCGLGWETVLSLPLYKVVGHPTGTWRRGH
jgi:hypothetical protein